MGDEIMNRGWGGINILQQPVVMSFIQAQEQASMDVLRASIRVQVIFIASGRICVKQVNKHACHLSPLLFLCLSLRFCCGVFLTPDVSLLDLPNELLEDVSVMQLCGLWRRLATRRGAGGGDGEKEEGGRPKGAGYILEKPERWTHGQRHAWAGLMILPAAVCGVSFVCCTASETINIVVRRQEMLVVGRWCRWFDHIMQYREDDDVVFLSCYWYDWAGDKESVYVIHTAAEGTAIVA